MKKIKTPNPAARIKRKLGGKLRASVGGTRGRKRRR